MEYGLTAQFVPNNGPSAVLQYSFTRKVKHMGSVPKIQWENVIYELDMYVLSTELSTELPAVVCANIL